MLKRHGWLDRVDVLVDVLYKSRPDASPRFQRIEN